MINKINKVDCAEKGNVRMEADTISKNGQSSKVQNKMKTYFVLLAACIILTGCPQDDKGYNCISGDCVAAYENPQYLTLEDCISICGNNNSGNNGSGNTAKDPEGTIPASIANGTRIDISFGTYKRPVVITWVSPNNFSIYNAILQDTQLFSICSVGKVNGLGSINQIPKSGFTQPTRVTNNSMPCDAGHGYIIKIESNDNSNQEMYIRLYVVESIISTGGGVMGAKVKYQYPFEP